MKRRRAVAALLSPAARAAAVLKSKNGRDIARKAELEVSTVTENPNRWEGPSFKGLTILGFWNESEAISEAKKKGSIPLEEPELCEQLGIPARDLEAWLSKHWIEHNILEVMDGKDKYGAPSVSLIRQHDGVRWDGLSPRRKSGKLACFQVRLFSPGNYADCPWPRLVN